MAIILILSYFLIILRKKHKSSRIVSNTLEWAEKKQMEKEYIYEKKEFN